MRWLVIAVLTCLVGCGLTSTSEMLDAIWANVDWEDGEVFIEELPGNYSTPEDDEKKVWTLRKIPIARSCSCANESCGCCIIYTFKPDSDYKVCIGVNTSRLDGFALTIRVYKFDAALVTIEADKCVALPTAPSILADLLVTGCVEPYGAQINATSIRGCIQFSLHLVTVKVESIDLDCFRLHLEPPFRITRELPLPEERPPEGWVNRGFKWVKRFLTE